MPTTSPQLQSEPHCDQIPAHVLEGFSQDFCHTAAEESPAPAAEESNVQPTFFELFDLLLKDQPRLNRLARNPSAQREFISRFLAVGLLAYTIFGVGLAIVFQAAGVWPELSSAADFLAGDAPLLRFLPEHGAFWSRWLDGSALVLIAAYVLGLIGAIGVCLPSFYFYGLLAGVRTTMLECTMHATKGMASAAVAVVGLLPIYIALVLGVLVLGRPDGLVEFECLLGMVLPFLAGLWGTHSLYVGFLGLADTLPADRRCRRTCFLRRLMLSWCACLTAVTPTMIFTLWQYLAS